MRQESGPLSRPCTWLLRGPRQVASQATPGNRRPCGRFSGSCAAHGGRDTRLRLRVDKWPHDSLSKLHSAPKDRSRGPKREHRFPGSFPTPGATHPLLPAGHLLQGSSQARAQAGLRGRAQPAASIDALKPGRPPPAAPSTRGPAARSLAAACNLKI